MAISRSKMSKLKDSAILTLNDFSRIKETSKPLSIYSSTASNLNQDNETFFQKALHHKNKILSYDKQKKTLDRLKTYDGRKENDPYNKVSRTDDAVQAMDKMCLNAKVYTVRDQQRKERKVLDDLYKKKEMKLDLMQEMERLKEMKRVEDMENDLKKMRQAGNKIVLQQIKDNELARIKQKEIEEKERLELLKRIEEENEKERQKNKLKAIENEKKLKESLEANRQAILLKQKKLQEEREEEYRIQIYNNQKAEREEKLFQEKKRLEKEKEMELQKMREKQEKAQDKRAELDAIIAKRAEEEKEMRERQKEKEELIFKQKKIEELLKANARQKLDKEIQLAEEAKKEQEEFMRIIKEHEKEIIASREREKNRIKKLLDHNRDLRIQIAEKEEKERMLRREVLEEGRKIRQNNDDYMDNIEQIRRDKIQKLRQMNINEKYIVPLERFSLKDLASSF